MFEKYKKVSFLLKCQKLTLFLTYVMIDKNADTLERSKKRDKRGVDMKSNMAIIMDLLGITPQMLSLEVGADVSLISRWRTGNRRLISGRKWATALAKYFIAFDKAHEIEIVSEVLRAFYPMEEIDTTEEKQELLERWLTQKSQLTEVYQTKRKSILLQVFAEESEDGIEIQRQKTLAYGKDDVHLQILHMLDNLIDMQKPLKARFVCPEGLALLTEDAHFSKEMMTRLFTLSKLGFQLQVVLRTDYKVSGVSAFSGPWLVAHLLGFVESYYYDDFHRLEDMKMMAVVGDQVSMCVYPDKEQGIFAEFSYDPADIKKIDENIDAYFDYSTQRFHYDFFQSPDHFLADTKPPIMGSVYLFAELPHFGIRGEAFMDALTLSEEEKTYLKEEAWPLFSTEKDMDKGEVFHIFCADEIESMLDKPRHQIMELSQLCHRRVYATTQVLVDHLAEIQKRLKADRTYHVCFLPERYFREMIMQIGVWGNKVSIGWIRGGRSTVCKDFFNVGALHGFSATIWNRIPGMVKSRASANAKLNTWLRRAKKYGYQVD